MTSSDYRVRVIFYGELEAFAARLADHQPSGLMPITRCRAARLAANPNAVATEPAMSIVELVSGEIVAYLGAFPGKLRLGGKLHPISWGSAGMVAPAHRGGRASALAFAALETPALRTVCSTGNSLSAVAMYRALGFAERRGVNAWSFGLWPKARLPWRRGLLRCAERILGLALAARYTVHRPEGRFSAAAEVLLDGPAGDRFVRDAAVRNYMVEQPWWPEDPLPTEAEKPYHFRWVGKKIQFLRVEILAAGSREVVGAGIFSLVRDEKVRVKLLDVAVREPGAGSSLLLEGMRLALDARADEYLVPPSLDVGPGGRVLLKHAARPKSASYFLLTDDAAIRACWDTLPLWLADGDTPFW